MNSITFSSFALAALLMSVMLIPASTAAVIDIRTSRIPDRLVLLAGSPAIVMLAFELTREQPAAAAYMLGGSAMFFGPLLLAHLWSPAAIGFGDIKLAAALGLGLGAIDPRLAVVALFVATGVTSSVGLLLHRRTMPLAPGLVGGTATACLVGGLIGMEFAPWR
jgi:leader peptidase (prepilin peptidase)/N-methyltransferase